MIANERDADQPERGRDSGFRIGTPWRRRSTRRSASLPTRATLTIAAMIQPAAAEEVARRVVDQSLWIRIRPAGSTSGSRPARSGSRRASRRTTARRSAPRSSPGTRRSRCRSDDARPMATTAGYSWPLPGSCEFRHGDAADAADVGDREVDLADQEHEGDAVGEQRRPAIWMMMLLKLTGGKKLLARLAEDDHDDHERDDDRPAAEVAAADVGG